MMNIKEMVQEQKDLIINSRRDLHRIPEPAYTEEKTSLYVAEYLNREGLKVETGIAQYGVVGLMETGKPGATLMIRSDMDALPITEETGLPFASTHEGAMHACGHDGHMAMVLGAATVLGKIKNNLKGNIKFIFQPAEEGPGGAKPMIDAGVMEDPRVDYSVGCHVWPDIPEETLGVRPGPIMAAMDRFDIEIIGKGGHGAMPHLCVDALEVGSQIINALQRIVSRHMNPLNPSVVTVGSFHAGSTFNVIPGEAHMCGTTRTFDLVSLRLALLTSFISSVVKSSPNFAFINSTRLPFTPKFFPLWIISIFLFLSCIPRSQSGSNLLIPTSVFEGRSATHGLTRTLNPDFSKCLLKSMARS